MKDSIMKILYRDDSVPTMGNVCKTTRYGCFVKYPVKLRENIKPPICNKLKM